MVPIAIDVLISSSGTSTLKISLRDVGADVQKYDDSSEAAVGGGVQRWRQTGSGIGDTPRLALSRLSRDALGEFRRQRTAITILRRCAVGVSSHHGTGVASRMCRHRTVVTRHCRNNRSTKIDQQTHYARQPVRLLYVYFCIIVC